MAAWGKILGGVAGYAIGGPIGALIGLAAGAGIDARRSRRDRDVEWDQPGEITEQAFTATIAAGVAALAAKLAKADGLVGRAEVEAFRSVFPPEFAELEGISDVYNEAKRSAEGYEVYAQQIADMFQERRGALLYVYELLWVVALADGDLHPAEDRFLNHVALIFGLSDQEVRAVRGHHRWSAAVQGEDTIDADHAVLGLSSDAMNEDVRHAHRQLVRELHPDRLIAQGVPEEMVAQATQRMASVNAAYDRVRKHRGM